MRAHEYIGRALDAFLAAQRRRERPGRVDVARPARGCVEIEQQGEGTLDVLRDMLVQRAMHDVQRAAPVGPPLCGYRAGGHGAADNVLLRSVVQIARGVAQRHVADTAAPGTMRSQLVPFDTARHAAPALPFDTHAMARLFALALGRPATV